MGGKHSTAARARTPGPKGVPEDAAPACCLVRRATHWAAQQAEEDWREQDRLFPDEEAIRRAVEGAKPKGSAASGSTRSGSSATGGSDATLAFEVGDFLIDSDQWVSDLMFV